MTKDVDYTLYGVAKILCRRPSNQEVNQSTAYWLWRRERAAQFTMCWKELRLCFGRKKDDAAYLRWKKLFPCCVLKKDDAAYPPHHPEFRPSDSSHLPPDSSHLPPPDSSHLPPDSSHLPPLDSSHLPPDSSDLPPPSKPKPEGERDASQSMAGASAANSSREKSGTQSTLPNKGDPYHQKPKVQLDTINQPTQPNNGGRTLPTERDSARTPYEGLSAKDQTKARDKYGADDDGADRESREGA